MPYGILRRKQFGGRPLNCPVARYLMAVAVQEWSSLAFGLKHWSNRRGTLINKRI
jgi:hypothetical protein